MTHEQIYNMPFAKIFPLLIAKAERKSRTKEEVYAITSWLTGYKNEEIDALLHSDISYGNFFLNAPEMNPKRIAITGVICGIRVENLEEPLMRDIRGLDKLIDELAKGKPIEKIINKVDTKFRDFQSRT